ncbi:MAG TPA: hypothetical protein VHX15_15840 [Frankiaceae bacterium]|jgi:hypothetical protein|nr:hypothetical protein [Frankiaceae bacterium]
MSYLESCAAAGDDPSAVAVSGAIRMALRGDLAAPLSILVPCDSPPRDRRSRRGKDDLPDRGKLTP